MKVIYSLWSGGLDSTIATYFFSQFYNVQPYHILLRNGGGKDAREKEAVDKIYEALKHNFPNVMPPIRVKHKIPKGDHRNEEMINFLKNEYDIRKVITGLHLTDREDVSDDFKNDVNWQYLSNKTRVSVYSFDRLDIHSKKDVFRIGLMFIPKEILELTWSCQLWWKSPCGKCFSCKDREALFNEVP